MTQSTTVTSAVRPQKRVRVWFADTPICTHVTEPDRARDYARAIGQRFFGLSVTIDDAPQQSAAEPLPQNSALWPLTVK
ncbi:MAG: hypothetical protein ACRDO7_03820 [Nocardioidaceae bacterium]